MDKCELKNFECPQNWGFDKFPDIEENLKRQEKGWLDDPEIYENNTKYGMQVDRFKVYCLKSFEAYRKKNYTDALKFIETADTTDAFMDKYKKVFKHVILASKAHILFATKSFDETKKICDMLNKDVFTDVEKAVVKYIKCRLQLKYGEPAVVGCIELINDAVKIVPEEAEFQYLLGLAMSRIRHFDFPPKPPSEVEFNALKKAVSLRKDSPEYAVALARLYIDNRFYVDFETRKVYETNAKSIYRTLLQYHESLLGDDISRCIYNLTKISFDPELEEYVKFARKKSDSILTNHYCGTFYLMNGQYEEALECLEKTVLELPFVASLVLQLMNRVKNKCINDSDINSVVKKWVEHYESLDVLKKKITLYLSVSQFYLIAMNNLKSASYYFLKAAELGISERFHINISKKYSMCNYLALLNSELSLYHQNDSIIVEAKKIIKTLPKNVLTQKYMKIIGPKLYEVRENIK